jgi:type II secretory pathway component GspD/PulD (secretin)
MKLLIATILTTLSFNVFADVPTISFNFQDADLSSVIKEYAKMSGQKFIVDANAKGKVTIINKDPVTVEEAFNQLSTALAVNGLAISKQGDQMVVMQARAVQRNLIDVSTELPPMSPTKMATWIINLKYISADEVNRQLRILTSNQGEVFPFTHTNQLIISDYTPNLYRVAKLIKELDLPAAKTPSKFAKAAEAAQKEDEAKMMAEGKGETPKFNAKKKK